MNFQASKTIDLHELGTFQVTEVTAETVDGQVVRATYRGEHTPVDGQPKAAEIDAQFVEPVPADPDAVLNAGWDIWSMD